MAYILHEEERTSPDKMLEANVTFAPLAASTYPPFSTSSVTIPPEETYMLPPELTEISFAVPPEEISKEPLLTVVLFAIPLDIDYKSTTVINRGTVRTAAGRDKHPATGVDCRDVRDSTFQDRHGISIV